MDGGDYMQVLHAKVWWMMELDFTTNSLLIGLENSIGFLTTNVWPFSVQGFTFGTHFMNLKGSGKSHMLHGGILPKS